MERAMVLEPDQLSKLLDRLLLLDRLPLLLLGFDPDLGLDHALNPWIRLFLPIRSY